ncbi:uncharacterized protein J8A68_001927 [[Candida] subhashii]|uniref:Uncharacterized protein n=1 Tax=[Candida] subhashii TaxID=561895 RepID=A0A8J5R0F9_9ASCO|nr:uncharacterized protein J8A68_001927 [[Candida] subhashii]KAG7664540.1 hypothetical protein J8A68_001927 [[Candida] subhashii]
MKTFTVMLGYIIVATYSLMLPADWSGIVKPTLLGLRDTKLRLSNSLQSLMTTKGLGSSFTQLSHSPSNYTSASISEFNKSSVDSDDLIFIPKELMNPPMFATLGLNNLFHDIQWLNLSNTQQLIIPKITEFQSMFIFNTSGEPILQFPNSAKQRMNHYSSGSLHNWGKVFSKSVPFTLPNLLELVDYYMIIPSNHYFDSLKSNHTSVYIKSLITIPREKLPIFRPSLTGDKPMVVFMFNQTSTSFVSDDKLKNTPIFTIKNYLAYPQDVSHKVSASVSNFFDKLAKSWLKSINYESLIHAVYCNLNVADNHKEEDSYCLKIQDDEQSVHIFPAFYELAAPSISSFSPQQSSQKSQLLSNQEVEQQSLHQTYYDLREHVSNSHHLLKQKTKQLVSKRDKYNEGNNSTATEIELQALRQIHDKLSHGAGKFNEFSYEFVHDPKVTIEKVDEKVDNKVDATVTRIINKKDHVKMKADEKKTVFIKEVEDKLDTLDDKTDLIADAIKRKKNELKKYRIRPKVFEKSEAITYYTDDDCDDEKDGKFSFIDELNAAKEDIPDDIPDMSIYENDIEYINKRDDLYEEYEQITQNPDGTILVPFSMWKLAEAESTSPRKKTYSQIINMDLVKPFSKRGSMIQAMASANDTDCQPITWYNIFHYSIFGEPKFCNDS